jgi:cyclopropane-fatty-acyl-phospholipid synthase
MARASDLRLVHLEDITPHYAETLKRWRENFVAAWDKVGALGFPESFRRIWEYYLAYCEGGYREGVLGDVQLLLAKPRYRVQPAD